jgi:hypothetical protein
VKSLGFFNLKVYLGHPFILEVHAGESDVQAESSTDSFAVTAAIRSEILEEILTKLAAALQNSEESINLKVTGKEILRDTSFPLTPPIHVLRSAADVLRNDLTRFDRALASRVPQEKKTAVRKSTKRKASKKKPRNE